MPVSSCSGRRKSNASTRASSAQCLGFEPSEHSEQGIELACIRILAGGEHALDDRARQADSMGALARETDFAPRFERAAESGQQAGGESSANCKRLRNRCSGNLE